LNAPRVSVKEGIGSYFFEDLTSIRTKKLLTEDRYFLAPTHQRYSRVRTRARAYLFSMNFDFGVCGVQEVYSESAGVSFAGSSGRDSLWDIVQTRDWLDNKLNPWLGKISGDPLFTSISGWRRLEECFLKQPELAGAPACIRYGVSQAFARGFAAAFGVSALNLFKDAFGVQGPATRVALHGSCGANWRGSVMSMLEAKLAYLPQGQFECLDSQIGEHGEKIFEWVDWFKVQAGRFGYSPTLTLDFHGALDEVFGRDIEKVATFIGRLFERASPHSLHIESPIHSNSFEEYRTRMHRLKELVSNRVASEPATNKASRKLRLIADEWANGTADIETLCKSGVIDGIHIKMPDTGMLTECFQAVSALKASNLFCLLGGSCTESMASAELGATLALVLKPDSFLVKPGMGFDEAYASIENAWTRCT
jgi:methylaspartate ammonia-lyase